MSKKIPVSSQQDPLQSPFASLQMEGLRHFTPPPATALPAGGSAKKYRIILRREKSQRGGKTVVVVSQFPTHLSPPELEKLLRDARKSLGCGGAMNGREIELQGDNPARVREHFESEGFIVGGV